MSTITNAANIPLNAINGSVPDVSGALQSYFQPLVFVPLTKSISGFQVVETPTPIEFRGTIQPFTPRQLLLKPEGQRAWSWFTIFAQPGIQLNVDDVVLYLGKQSRIMSKTNFTLYGYVHYTMIQDWTGAGP